MEWLGHFLNTVLAYVVLALFVLVMVLQNRWVQKELVRWILKHYSGPIGEWVVNEELRKLPSSHILLKNLLIPRSDDPNRTTQIDHVVLSPHGVFVIETKNVTGKLVAGDSDVEWVVWKGRNRYKLKNPVRQNYLHVQSIRKVLELDDSFPMESIVAFSNRTDLKAVKSRTPVVHFHEVREEIGKHALTVALTDEDVQRFAAALRRADIPGRKARSKHVEDIEVEIAKRASQRSERKPAEDPNHGDTEPGAASNGNGANDRNQRSCPSCGSEMVLRTGRRGPFWGCSSFPKCRHTESM